MITIHIRAATEERLLAQGLRLPAPAPALTNGRCARSARDVLKRAFSLALASFVAQQLDPAAAQKDAEQFGLLPCMTPLEASTVTRHPGATSPSDYGLTWGLEAAAVLVWSIGLLQDLSLADDYHQSEDALCRLLSARSLEEVEQQARPRSDEELLRELDYYRCYRQVYRQASVGEPVHMWQQVGPLGPESVLQRVKALEWLLDAALPWEDPSG